MIEPNESGLGRALRWLRPVDSMDASACRQNRKRPYLEPLESRRLLTSISEFSTPSPNSAPSGITTGVDGNVWFTENSAGKIGVINPATHKISEFKIAPTSTPFAITSGSDGNIWFTDIGTNSIGTINPATHVYAEYTIPTGDSVPLGIASVAGGNLWFTEQVAGQIGMLNPMTHAFSEFEVPGADTLPTGITVGSDGNLWFTEEGADAIGVFNMTTQAITSFAIPNTGSKPYAITAGPDGNLWFTDLSASIIWQMNPTTDAFTEFNLPTSDALPVGITAGPDGNIYFTETQAAAQIGLIDPTTGAVTEYKIPSSGSVPNAVTVGSDGNVWLTETGTSKIAVVTLDQQLTVASQPPGTTTAGDGFGLTISDVYDSGVVDQDHTGVVTLALSKNPGGGTLGGSLTAAFVNGTATFTGLTLTTAANGYSISASSSGETSVTSGTFNVAAAAASQLAIIAQPPGTDIAGNGFGVQVGVFDRFGNPETSFDGTASVTLANNPSGTHSKAPSQPRLPTVSLPFRGCRSPRRTTATRFRLHLAEWRRPPAALSTWWPPRSRNCWSFPSRPAQLQPVIHSASRSGPSTGLETSLPAPMPP